MGRSLLVCVLGGLVLGCGSVRVGADASSTGDGSGTAGAGGSGAGGSGSGGSGSAGTTGTGGTGGCPPGQSWCPGCTPGSGSCGNTCAGFVCPEVDAGGPPDGARGGSGGSGGTTGSAGTGGMAATGGRGGAAGTGVGGTGGAASNCALATMVDRTCATAADCVAVMHVTNCCGGQAWIGVRASEKQRYATLEAACRQSYPPCGCFDGRNSADDGSRIPTNGTAAVTCEAGTCKTYAPACGRLCPTGASCLTCTTAAGATTSTCIRQCTDVATCDSGIASRCLRGQTLGLCAPEALSCEMPD